VRSRRGFRGCQRRILYWRIVSLHYSLEAALISSTIGKYAYSQHLYDLEYDYDIHHCSSSDSKQVPITDSTA
jgi:hypothetical protein